MYPQVTGEFSLSSLETIATIATISLAAVAIGYVLWVIRSSGAGRVDDAELVKHMVETAPYERLSNILPRKS